MGEAEVEGGEVREEAPLKEEVNVVPTKILSASDILDSDDIQIIDVPIDEWKGTVRLRQLNAEQAHRFARAIRDPDPEKQAEATILIITLSAIDEEGNLIFTKEDVEKIKRKSGAAVIRLQQAIIKLNELLGAHREEAKND